MDTIKLSNAIQNKIEELEEVRKQLKPRSDEKNESIRKYKEARLKSIISLKAEGEPTTLILKLAEGRCTKEEWEMNVADSNYRNALEWIDSLKAELNGLQSINRHLSET